MGASALEQLNERLDAAVTRVARVRRRPWWASALVGLGCAALFLAVRAALGVFYGEATGFMILLPAVILASLAAGRLAGLTAVFACLFGGWAVVGLDASGAGVWNRLGQVATVNFIIVGVFVAVVAAALRKVLGRLDASLVMQRETEGELTAMVDQAAAGIARVGLDGRVVAANARFAEILGLPRGQVVGTTTDQVSHPDDVEPTARALEASLSGGSGQVEKRYIRPDGSVIWALLNLRALTAPGGDIVGHIAVVIDITAAKAAEARLRESEERFRAVADTAPVLIWVTAQDRTREFVNQAYVAFNGGTYDEARLADWREATHPDDHERIISESVAGEATREPFAMEARYRRCDGEYRWLRSYSRPRLSEDGSIIGFVGVAFDVTGARQAQIDLTRINELLEERVGEALAEKAQAEADLMHAQKMEAVGRLTGGVAHDFNNLLTVVIGALDLMLKSPEDAARQKKLGEAALAAARRGEGLTHQLLAFSRRQALRPEPTDLNALIRQGEPLLKRGAGEAITFKLKLKRGGARANVDAGQFEAALLNLVVNARDAIGDRGGSIEVQTQACSVAVGEAPDLPAGDYVCVVVRDDGAGMDPEVIGRVFEPFFTTKAVGKGTGLGLSQVYGFARQSGGGVTIASTPGVGTEIRLYLPPVDRQDDKPIEQTAAAPRVEGRRVLLVEDDESVAAIAVEQLRGLGLEVRAAETAARALEMLKTERFDVMLSDVVMPGGMTGIGLARECGRLHPGMKVVLTSGYAGEDVDAALADAPWPFLRKPYSGEQLAEVLGAGMVAEPA